MLIIVQTFKIWKHYLKSSTKTIEVWSNHNNLREFMKQKKLNFKQVRWVLTLTVFDFEIFHRFDKTNSANKSSRRFNYEKILLNKIILLSTLQNKLTLSNIDNLLSLVSQSKRENLNNLNFKLILVLTSNVVETVNGETLSQSIKKQLQISFASMFQLTDVSVIISRRNVRVLSKKIYEESIKLIKFLIQKFQTTNIWTKEFRVKKSVMFHRRRTFKI